MKLSIIIEIAILIIFLITAPVVMLVERNVALSNEAKTNENAKAYLQKGDQLYSQIKYNDASVQYWEAIKRDPNLAEAHFRLAEIYYKYLWNYEVLNELREIERIDSKYPQLYLLMGKIYNRMSDTNKAYEAFQRSLTLEPYNSETHYYLGTIYQQRNTKEEALKEYEKAVTDTTSSSDKESIINSYLQLGRIYKTDKDIIKAVEMLKKALVVDPKSAEVISELTGVYSQQAGLYKSEQKFAEAARIYEEIVKLDPNNSENVEYYSELGSIYRNLQLYGKAIAAYTAVTRLDQFNFDAFTALKELEMLKNGGEGQD